MAPDPDGQERAYRTLKVQIRTGTLIPGHHFHLANLADELGLSPTPIREALYRLMGEGLVEAGEFGGFRMVLPQLQELHDLYMWTSQLLLSAIDVIPTPILASLTDQRTSKNEMRGAAGSARQLIPFLEGIGSSTNNAEFVWHIGTALDRLGPVRPFENLVLQGIEAEAARMMRADTMSVRPALRRKIASYYRRRLERLPQILAAYSRS